MPIIFALSFYAVELGHHRCRPSSLLNIARHLDYCSLPNSGFILSQIYVVVVERVRYDACKGPMSSIIADPGSLGAYQHRQYCETMVSYQPISFSEARTIFPFPGLDLDFQP